MSLFGIFLLLFLTRKDVLGDESRTWVSRADEDNFNFESSYELDEGNTTKNGTGVFLWRAQGVFNTDVMDEFYSRARFTEDIWMRNNNTIDFLIYQSEIPRMTKFLDDNNVTHKVLLDNVTNLNDTIVDSIPIRRKAEFGDTFLWNEYPSLAEINRYLVKTAAAYRRYCSVTSIGRTASKKSINMLKITSGGRADTSILIDAGIHGNEWTAVFSTLYFIDAVVKNYRKQHTSVKRRDWYIIPVLNPDGFEYSRTKERDWKKNRRKFYGDCGGVDLNRNFDINWNHEGSSDKICSPYYRGTEPFSEEETKAFKALVDRKHFYGYISIHSGGARVITPYITLGVNQRSQKKTQEVKIADQMASAMKKVGKVQFLTNDPTRSGNNDVGPGMSTDWMYFTKKVKYTYTITTRGQDDDLPPKDILPALKEVQAGIYQYAKLLKD